MKANRAFELIVRRGGREPAFMADRGRLDRVEVISIDTGEVELFWELPAKEATKLIRQLRTDLYELDPGDFIEAWEGRDSSADRPR
jgi:hypothetical protein